MTINDQIRNEKLQYDLNREETKISALPSGNIQKYEYLTGEDILPSNQQQIIEQAKFSYSPSSKAFEKQVQTIEDQGEKQVDAIENLKDANKQVVNINDDEGEEEKNDKSLKIFIKQRLDKIEELTKKSDGNSLVFTKLSTGKTYDFTGKNDPLSLLNKVRNGRITIERAKEVQEDLNNNKTKLRK